MEFVRRITSKFVDNDEHNKKEPSTITTHSDLKLTDTTCVSSETPSKEPEIQNSDKCNQTMAFLSSLEEFVVYCDESKKTKATDYDALNAYFE